MAKQGFSKFRSRLWAFVEIERQIRRGRACTGPSLAHDLEVDPRTIRRYIQFMQNELGAPIEYDPIEQTYRFAHGSWTMPNVHLSDRELTALAVGLRSLAEVMPLPFIKPLEGLFAKLIDALPANHREEIQRLKERVDIVPVAIASKGSEWVEPLMQAMRDETSVEIDYYILGKRKAGKRRVDPYHLRFFAGAWYLIGYDHQTTYFPVFNLARVRSFQMTEHSFRRRAFSASEYFQDAVGITVGGAAKVVTIVLSGRAADTVSERVWPKGFTYVANKDGTVTLTGKIGKLDDLLAWVAAAGGDAVIR